MSIELISLQDRCLKSSLVPVKRPVLAERGVKLWMKREDLVDPELSGNKFYKLYHHLRKAFSQGHSRLASFGGPYSNHLHSLSAAGKRYGFSTVGVVRGHWEQQMTPTLADASNWGMTLRYVDKDVYQSRDHWQDVPQLSEILEDCYVIPEGAGDVLGALGCRAIGEALGQKIPQGFNHVFVPCGTGSTLAGVAAGVPRGVTVHGISVLKGEDNLSTRITAMLKAMGCWQSSWRLHTGFHCGGYGKCPDYLADYIRGFERETGIQLDPVYTAKMMLAIEELVIKGDINPGAGVVAIHTGGIQGRRGYPSLSSREPTNNNSYKAYVFKH